MNASVALAPTKLIYAGGIAADGALNGSELNRLRIELIGLSDDTAKLQVIRNQAAIWNMARHPRGEITEVLMDAGTAQLLNAERIEKAIIEGLSVGPEQLKSPSFRIKNFSTCARQRDELEALVEKIMPAYGLDRGTAATGNDSPPSVKPKPRRARELNGGKHTPVKTLGEQIQRGKAKSKASSYTKEKPISGVDEDLLQMNGCFAVVNVSGKARVVTFDETGRLEFFTFEDFKKLTSQHKKLVDNKRIGAGRWWLDQPDRRQYGGITFVPGGEQEIDGRLNAWSGWKYEPVKGNCGLYLHHVLNNICSGNKEHYEYLLNVMADAIQNPNKPGEVAVVIRSDEQGTGKNVFVSNFGKLFGRHFRTISQPEHLVGKFNAHLEFCCVLFADECFWGGDLRHEGILNDLITGKTLNIERKGIDAIEVPNRLHLFMASNTAWVVPAGPTARRFFVLDVATTRIQDSEYFEAIQEQMDNGGTEALLHMLKNRNLKGFNIRKVPQTEALMKQKLLSLRGVDLLVQKLATEGEIPAQHESYPHIAITSGESEQKGFYWAVRNMFPEMKNRKEFASIVIARELKEKWRCKTYRSNGKNGIEFPSLFDLRTHFERKYGPQDWDKNQQWITANSDPHSNPHSNPHWSTL